MSPPDAVSFSISARKRASASVSANASLAEVVEPLGGEIGKGVRGHGTPLTVGNEPGMPDVRHHLLVTQLAGTPS